MYRPCASLSTIGLPMPSPPHLHNLSFQNRDWTLSLVGGRYCILTNNTSRASKRYDFDWYEHKFARLKINVESTSDGPNEPRVEHEPGLGPVPSWTEGACYYAGSPSGRVAYLLIAFFYRPGYRRPRSVLIWFDDLTPCRLRLFEDQQILQLTN